MARLCRVVALANDALRIQGVDRDTQQALLERHARLGAPDPLGTPVPDLALLKYPQTRIRLDTLNASPPDAILRLIGVR